MIRFNTTILSPTDTISRRKILFQGIRLQKNAIKQPIAKTGQLNRKRTTPKPINPLYFYKQMAAGKFPAVFFADAASFKLYQFLKSLAYNF